MGWDEYGIARYIALVIMKLASVEKIARISPAGLLDSLEWWGGSFGWVNLVRWLGRDIARVIWTPPTSPCVVVCAEVLRGYIHEREPLREPLLTG